ncbi:MAG: hypothetical protein M9922_12170 [Microthrixaceae bacterium]|nr:hypothetical protein [Microthrixaceae bacterium]
MVVEVVDVVDVVEVVEVAVEVVEVVDVDVVEVDVDEVVVVVVVPGGVVGTHATVIMTSAANAEVANTDALCLERTESARSISLSFMDSPAALLHSPPIHLSADCGQKSSSQRRS